MMNEVTTNASDTDARALESVRKMEQLRIEAIRSNDVEAMAHILDRNFIYIHNRGNTYDKAGYLTAVRTHGLTYSDDVHLTESNHRADGEVVIMIGMMHGHARTGQEQDVHNDKSMRVWRRRDGEWKLLAWQCTAVSCWE
jgi:hypothetical protein